MVKQFSNRIIHVIIHILLVAGHSFCASLFRGRATRLCGAFKVMSKHCCSMYDGELYGMMVEYNSTIKY